MTTKEHSQTHRRHSDDAHHSHEQPQKPAPGSVRAATRDHARAAHDHQENHSGHDRHAGHSVDMFRKKFWGALLLTIPTLLWAPMTQHWIGYDAPGGPA